MTSHKTTARKIQSHVGITLKLQDLRLADIQFAKFHDI